MCSSMEPTGAYFLIALDADWNAHPKNQVLAIPATHNTAAAPASIRPRPVFTMPTIYGPNSTVYVRDLFKLEKELFERIDEAETSLHAAIVESLAPGTVRTINSSTPSGIASLSALQLVGLVHQLFSTPTMQDINTVNADLLRPMHNFEDFPDHITEHVNHYDSLASFMQPCANIAKIKTFRESIQRRPQFDSVITSWEEQNPNVLTRDFNDFTTYLLTRFYNLDQDVKPRGGNAYSTRKGGKGKHPKGKGRGRGRGKGKGKGKDHGKGRSLADNDEFEQPLKRPRLHERQAQTGSTSIPLQTATTLSTQTLDRNPRIDHTNLPQIVRSFACMAPTPPKNRSPATPTPTRTYTTTAPTTGSTFHTMKANVASCPTTSHIRINKNKHAYRPTVHRAATTQSNLSALPRS
jgi:hypothetical protein